MKEFVQWNIIDLNFKTHKIFKWHEFPLQVIFEHETNGLKIVLDGFWNGKDWAVRFAPTAPGIWVWKTLSIYSEMNGQKGSINCIKPAAALVEKNPNLRGHLKISPNNRFFQYADDSPFLWLGDTVWNIFSSACGINGPFYKLIEDRKNKNFNIFQSRFLDCGVRNEGGYPFPSNTDYKGTYEELNADYFKMVDVRIEKLWALGFVLALHPDWVGKRTAVKSEDYKKLSRYLLARYGAYNIVWSLAGEYQYSYPCELENAHIWNKDDWKSLGLSIIGYNSFKHPVTIHPSSRLLNNPPAWSAEAQQQSSGGEFHHEPWLDFNWTQTGHREDLLWFVPYRSQENYFKHPSKPVVHSEGWYENFDQWGRPCTADEARWQVWAAFLSGCCGHTYGTMGIYHFFDPANASEQAHGLPAFATKLSWQEGLNSQGSYYMSIFYKFMASIQWWTLEPNNERIRINGISPDIEKHTDPICAACMYKLIVTYIPAGNIGKEIRILFMGPLKYTANWFNPRSGERMISIENVAEDTTGTGCWIAPPIPDDKDWILYLEAI